MPPGSSKPIAGRTQQGKRIRKKPTRDFLRRRTLPTLCNCALPGTRSTARPNNWQSGASASLLTPFSEGEKRVRNATIKIARMTEPTIAISRRCHCLAHSSVSASSRLTKRSSSDCLEVLLAFRTASRRRRRPRMKKRNRRQSAASEAAATCAKPAPEWR